MLLVSLPNALQLTQSLRRCMLYWPGMVLAWPSSKLAMLLAQRSIVCALRVCSLHLEELCIWKSFWQMVLYPRCITCVLSNAPDELLQGEY